MVPAPLKHLSSKSKSKPVKPVSTVTTAATTGATTITTTVAATITATAATATNSSSATTARRQEQQLQPQSHTATQPLCGALQVDSICYELTISPPAVSAATSAAGSLSPTAENNSSSNGNWNSRLLVSHLASNLPLHHLGSSVSSVSSLSADSSNSTGASFTAAALVSRSPRGSRIAGFA